MTTQFKTKAEVKASQAASQDKPSQDASGSIPTIDGLETSLEILYAGHRTKARQITQGIKVQAYQDEFESAIAELKKGEVQPDFLQTLQKKYAPALDQMLMPLLSQSLSPAGADDDTLPLPPPSVERLIDRLHFLSELERIGNITDEESSELLEIRKKLSALGVDE